METINHGYFVSIKSGVFIATGEGGGDPFNPNFRAEVRKFLGGKWIATGPEGLVPFHSQKEFPAHLMADADHCCSC